MKRRDFLKATAGVSAGALVSLPSLPTLSKEPIGKLPEGFKVDTNLTRDEYWFLSTPPFVKLHHSGRLVVDGTVLGEGETIADHLRNRRAGY